ncbi:MAG: hypothetical protein AEth_00490 [Candidatus Argoarchaeum ethanivorans]|uniref:Uncharacterized protein n=1 Tax=Candidatus Argoarchaeum ethanivorans TaxID=2608793 RepID=A0A8B3S6D5_9EURY|nr:MAG: hypothetical protein AEth_00490 [Candidatus Argoarchaeum ethanivorans]
MWYGRRWYDQTVTAPSGYEYIGPCRCGGGPHAYYQAPGGQVVHASQVFAPAPGFTPVPGFTKEDERKMLEEELAQIKKRLEELEK